MDIDDWIDVDYDVVEEPKSNPEMEELESEQQEEKDYFQKQEGKINDTKAKLQKLLEKLQNEPPKGSIGKQLLRYRINRLRVMLDRSMAKYDIEFEADRGENAAYDKFIKECNALRTEIDGLRDKEEDLLYQIEVITRTTSYRAKNDKNVANKMNKMAPKGKKGQVKDVKAPKKDKSSELQEQLDQVQSRITELENELNQKIEDYKKYKSDLKRDTKDAVYEKMEELKDLEKERKAKQKEEFAVAKPNVWAKIRGTFKAAMDKFSKWNENRKLKNEEIEQRKDQKLMSEVEQSMNTKTKREQFLKENEMDPILKMYLEESKKEGFDKSEFAQRIANSSFTYEQKVKGMRSIDSYIAEQKMKQDISKTVTEVQQENAGKKLESEEQK